MAWRADAVDPEIDRHRMAQVAQMREPHARQRVPLHRPRRCQTGKVAVGERQHDHVSRRLAEIDRLDDLVESGGGGREQMHRLSEQGPRHGGAVQSLQSDDDEVALTRLGRVPWPVVLVRHPRADRLHKRRIGLPATAAKPLTRKTSWVSATAATRAARAAGSAISGSATTKLSKSSWSCSSSASCQVRRFAMSSSVPMPSPSSSGGIDLAVGDQDDLHARAAARRRPPPAPCRRRRRRAGRACSAPRGRRRRSDPRTLPRSGCRARARRRRRAGGPAPRGRRRPGRRRAPRHRPPPRRRRR